MVAKVWAFKMGTHELWFDGGCQVMRLSTWGLMSFGLIVANLWGFQHGDSWASVWLLPTYEAFKMGTYELWFHCCQLMRLSKWGLMSFGLMVANLWASKMATRELQQQKHRAQFQKPPPYHKRIKEHETNPTMTTVWWNISPTIIHIEYLLRKTKKRER
jgi:hypothetical protein